MSDEIKKHISDVNIWKRALFMLLFAILFGLAKVVTWAVVIFQFLIVLFTGSKNKRLLEFGQKLTTYIYQIVLFQTFNTESHPFPFGDWPDGPPAENPVEPVPAPQAEPEPVDTASDDEVDDDAESDATVELEQDAPDKIDQDAGSDENPDNKD
jgi:hypothetical protein